MWRGCLLIVVRWPKYQKGDEMELDWDIYILIGLILGFWMYYIVDRIVLKTYVRKRLIQEFFKIADEMGYNLVEKDPEIG